jgi:hypothetical protein
MRFITLSPRALAAIVLLGLGCAGCSAGGGTYGSATPADARAPTAPQPQPARIIQPPPTYEGIGNGGGGGGMGGSY